jgi:hypothetical protein
LKVLKPPETAAFFGLCAHVLLQFHEYVSCVNDLALVDNGPLTSMAVLPDGLVARKARGVPIPMKYRTKACAELFPSPRHRPAAIGKAINNFKQISRYQRSFFLTGRR